MTLTGQIPSLEVIVLASLWSVAHCPTSVHFLKVFFFSCSQNGPRHCLGPVPWFREHVPWKGEDSPVNCKTVDGDVAPAWHSLKAESYLALGLGNKKTRGRGSGMWKNCISNWFCFSSLVTQISAYKPELNLLCTEICPHQICAR